MHSGLSECLFTESRLRMIGERWGVYVNIPGPVQPGGFDNLCHRGAVTAERAGPKESGGQLGSDTDNLDY